MRLIKSTWRRENEWFKISVIVPINIISLLKLEEGDIHNIGEIPLTYY